MTQDRLRPEICWAVFVLGFIYERTVYFSQVVETIPNRHMIGYWQTKAMVRQERAILIENGEEWQPHSKKPSGQ